MEQFPIEFVRLSLLGSWKKQWIPHFYVNENVIFDFIRFEELFSMLENASLKPILLLEKMRMRNGCQKQLSVNEFGNIELLSLNLFEYCRLNADNFKLHKNALCVMVACFPIL